MKHCNPIAPTLALTDSSPLCANAANRPARRTDQRLSFQEPNEVVERRAFNVNSDIAMAYGIDKTLPDAPQDL